MPSGIAVGEHSRAMLMAIRRASTFVSIGPVLPIDRIKLDATCAKCIFDSFRHFASRVRSFGLVESP
jgi:hypothetical protein